jgi:hypothetical protein
MGLIKRYELPLYPVAVLSEKFHKENIEDGGNSGRRPVE